MNARVDEEVDFNVLDCVRFWSCRDKNRAGVRVRFGAEFLEACRNGYHFRIRLRDLLELKTALAQNLYMFLMNWFDTWTATGLTRDVRQLCRNMGLDPDKPLWESKKQLRRGLKQVQAVFARDGAHFTLKYRFLGPHRDKVKFTPGNPKTKAILTSAARGDDGLFKNRPAASTTERADRLRHLLAV